MTSEPSVGRRSPVLHNLLVALGYVAASYYGVYVARIAGPPAVAWPASAVAVVAMFVGGVRWLPGVFIGGIIAARIDGHAWMLAPLFAMGTVVEAAVAAWLGRLVKCDLRFARASDILHFVWIAATGAAVGAFLGVESVIWGGLLGSRDALSVWQTWWLGDTIGIVAFGPALATMLARPTAPMRPRPLELSLLAASLAAAAFLVLVTDRLPGAPRAIITFAATLPILLWAGLRCDLRVASQVALLLSALTTLGAKLGTGSLALPDPRNSALVLQLYQVAAVLVILVVAAGVSERETTLARLRESESRLNLVFEGTSDFLTLFRLGDDGQPRVLMANRRWFDGIRALYPDVRDEDIVGRTPAELQQLLHTPEGRFAWRMERFDSVLKTGDPQLFDSVEPTPAGDVHVETMLVALPDASGNHRFVLSTLRDVTARHQAEQRLRESEVRLDTVFNSSSDPMQLYAVEPGGEFRIVMMNRATEALLRRMNPGYEPGWTQQSGLRESLRDVVGSDEVVIRFNESKFREALARRDALRYDDEIVTSDGRMFVEVTLVPVFDETAQPTHLLRTTRDITARVMSEERWGLVLRANNEGIWDWDLTTGEFWGSPRWRQMSGFANDDEVPKSFDKRMQIVHPDDRERFRQTIEAVWAGRERDYRMEFRLLLRDGTCRSVLSRGTILRDAEGRPTRMVGSHLDITDLRKVEAQNRDLELALQQSQKMEALGTLAGGIAHDFNNILTGMLGNAQLARTSLNDLARADDHLSEIVSAVHRARDVVQRVLMFSRRQHVSRRVIALDDVTTEAVRLLRASLPSTIDLRVHGPPPDTTLLIEADPTQIHQVVMNLGTNAAQAIEANGHASADGGRIDVALDVVTPSAEERRRHPDLREGLHARLLVRDTGCGMDPATQPRIFEPFFTTKGPGQGTGLGLAVVHGIVRSHDGVIDVDSARGRGTTFTIKFPLAPAARRGAAALSATTDADGAGRGEHILFVDDESPIVMVGRRLLEMSGYRVTSFNNPRAALAAFSQAPETFDMVVTDLTMPGLSGTELITEVRTLRPSIPVLLTTGYVSTPDAARVGPAVPLLQKPFDREALVEAISREMTRSRAPAGAA